MDEHLKNLIKMRLDLEALAGQWDGDFPGKLEDQAHICGEIVDHIKTIEPLLEELVNQDDINYGKDKDEYL